VKASLNHLLRAIGSALSKQFVGRGHRPSDGSTHYAERRREPRYRLETQTDTDRVTIRYRDTDCTVHDLSTRGLCFLYEDTDAAVELGTVYETEVDLCGTVLSLKIKLINQRQQYVGCEIVDMPPLWRTEVAKVLDPMRIGQQLREIQPRYMKEDPSDRRVRWFQGGPACDLYVWLDAGEEVEQAQIMFMWQVVDWSRKAGLRTGHMEQPAHNEPRRGYARSDIFHLQAPPDDETLSIARRILAASSVPEDIRGLFDPHGSRAENS
jgi:hypothetical protein